MERGTRNVLDRAFSSLGIIAIALMAAALLVMLAPIFVRGTGAVVFRGTIEFRLMMLEKFGHGDRAFGKAQAGGDCRGFHHRQFPNSPFFK